MAAVSVKRSIDCATWCKVGFVTCVDRDPARIGFRNDTVRVIHDRITFFCAFWVRLYYMYTDDTCVGQTADLAINQLNKALREFYNLCLNNRLTPHPTKSEVTLFTKGTRIGPLALVYLGNAMLSLVTKTKMLGLIIEQKLTWMANVLAKKTGLAQTFSFFTKRNFKGLLF